MKEKENKKEVKELKKLPPPPVDDEEDISDEELDRLLKEEEQSGAEEGDTSAVPTAQGLSSFFRRLVPFGWFTPAKSSPTDTAAAAPSQTK